jgi:hypothetical protein
MKAVLVAIAVFLIAPYVAPSPRIEIPAELLAASDQVQPQPLYRFTSDGCSGGMSFAWHVALGHGPDWEHCCVAHDFAYWRGGSSDDRQNADAHLLQCVDASGHPLWAWLMWLGVRPGGSPYLPTAWRWGYGWAYLGT